MLLEAIISKPTLEKFKEEIGENAHDIWQQQRAIPDTFGYWCLLLKRKLMASELNTDATRTITILDVGAGINFLPTFLVIKDALPAAKIRYICIDPAQEGALLLKSLGEAKESIEYIIGSSTDEQLLAAHGLAEETVNIVLSVNPVVNPPMIMPNASKRGIECILQQKRDFFEFFSRIMPKILRKTGLFFSIVYNEDDVSPLKTTVDTVISPGRTVIISRTMSKIAATNANALQEEMLCNKYTKAI